MSARNTLKRADAPRAGGRESSVRARRPAGSQARPAPPPAADPLPTLGSKVRYTIPEAGHLLGMSVSLLYQRLRTGELESARDGARRYITDEEIRRYGNLSH